MTIPPDSENQLHRQQQRPWVLITGLAGFLVMSCIEGIRPDTLRETVVSTPPSGSVVPQHDWADESSCIDCHDQAAVFHQTGHANTLVRATDSRSRKLLSALQDSDIGRAESVEAVGGSESLFFRTAADGVSFTAEPSWCFGSGAHARTWVATLPDTFEATDMLELRWTWYHSTEDFNLTPGQPSERSPGAIGSLGLLFDGPRAWRCFNCHTTRLPVHDGRIDESRISPGVTCQRCHGPRRRHVESEGEWHDPTWITSTRDDAIRLCAQCHRHPDEIDAADIRTDNIDIVRFQPVGLSQSACFQNSEMTCITCHDPHRPLASQDSFGIWQCVQCHNPEHSTDVLCAAGMRDKCVSCHMPKVKVDVPVSFTDHWIRVRETDESAP